MSRGGLTPRSIVWLAITGVLIAIGLLGVLAPPDRAKRNAALLPAFDAQGHRGARGLYPENTLPAFEGALAIGVTTLEMDIGMTRDGVLVAHHDRRLNPERTRGPDGGWLSTPAPALFEMTADELLDYDVGRVRPEGNVARRFPEQRGGDGIRIPRLKDVIARAETLSEGWVRYNIEIKTAPDAPAETATPEAIAEALVALIADAGVAARTTVQSFDWRGLRHVQEIAPALATAYLTAERDGLNTVRRGRPGTSPWTAGIDVDAHDGSVAAAVAAAGGRVWSPYFRDLRAADLAEAHRRGLKVVVWTVNEPADMASLIDFGVDGIITDYPDRLRKVMAAKGLPLPPAFGG